MVEKILTFKKIEILRNYIFFFYVERDYVTSYNKVFKRFVCTCENGSFYGVNNKQICRHKKKCMEFVEDLKKKPIEYYWLMNTQTKFVYLDIEKNVDKRKEFNELFQPETNQVQ